jgi:hypothetical protein
LDAVDLRKLRGVFHRTAEYLCQSKELERFRGLCSTLLAAFDGTGYFRSESIHCPQCGIAQAKGTPTVYSHSVLIAAIVTPGMPYVIALEPESIVPQDGADKQDREQLAARCWIREIAPQYSYWDLTIAVDDLYPTQPML